MSQEQQQLRFSVEESVWFQRGQEVAELISIALDPDISIHEHDQYISIRGALQLTGEYKIDKDANVEERYEYANVRYINEVSTSEDGVSILHHRFPVDITIPNNRIENLEEVYVSIESFDYELPELKCLKLVADLSISGISNEEVQIPQRDNEAEEEVVEELEPLYRTSQQDPIENESELFSDIQPHQVQPFSSFYDGYDRVETSVERLEGNEIENIPEKEIENEVKTAVEIPSPNVEIAEEVATETEIEEERIQVEEVRKEEINDASEDTILEEINNEVIDSNELEDKGFENEKAYDPFIVEVRKEQEQQDNALEKPREVQYSFFSKTEENEDNEDLVKVEKVENEREESDPKDSHYLTSLFARDDDEDFTRLKMCIVQQGDTAEKICERYDITVQQLLRVNEFRADQDVFEGQILYIPAYSTSK